MYIAGCERWERDWHLEFYSTGNFRKNKEAWEVKTSHNFQCPKSEKANIFAVEGKLWTVVFDLISFFLNFF